MSRGPRQYAIFAWAWPAGSLDHLLQAAAHAHDDAAQAAWRQWAHGKDLDDVGFSEMRLLAAVAPRLKTLDPTHAERNRILGIERSLWSRSQMVLREVQPALAALRQAGIEIMVLKGAARAARDRTAVKRRFVNDIDILVPCGEFRRAFDLLDAAGWRSTAAGTAPFHRTLLDRVHGVNLIRGELADLDLHRSAFHHPHQSLADDQQMWARSDAGSLTQCSVRIPSATDTVVLALAHGGQGGHRTSDWLLDIVDAVHGGAVDWDLLPAIVERRRLETPAAVALTYLADKLQCPIPADTLAWIVDRARRAPAALAAGLLLSRPKTSLNAPLKLARMAVKAWRARGKNTHPGREPIGVTRRAWPALRGHGFGRVLVSTGEPAQPVYQTIIRPPDRAADAGWQGVVDVTLALPALRRARRIEFELNAGHRHLARVKFRKWTARARTLTLRFQAPVTLNSGEVELRLEAAPGRGLRARANHDLAERYAPVPFNVIDVRCRRLAA